MPPSLDHVIILLPYESLLRPPAWLSDHFTITPGGKHGDGKTENRLICFRDGSYIELIAFINDDPGKRLGHWWDKDYGIVDFSFAYFDGDATTHFSELEARLKGLEWGNDAVKVEYEKPQTGARMRPDGQGIQWQVTFPVVTTGYQRGVGTRTRTFPFSARPIVSPRMIRCCEAVAVRPSLTLLLLRNSLSLLMISRRDLYESKVPPIRV